MKAVIWDFDNTMVDSKLKNYNVTKRIIEEVMGKKSSEFKAMDSLSVYHKESTKSNWRSFYARAFNMSMEEVEQVGNLWPQFQLEDMTPVLFYDGIFEAIEHFSQFPQGILSLNSRQTVLSFLDRHGVTKYFSSIIGYEEISVEQHKPATGGLIKCIEESTQLACNKVFYIGDMESDTACVFNVNQHFASTDHSIDVISIYANYDVNEEQTIWINQPHYIARKPQDIISVVIDH